MRRMRGEGSRWFEGSGRYSAKWYHILGPELEKAGAKDLCGRGGLVPRHGLPVFHNPVKGIEVVSGNQAWAADITSIRTDEGFLYLSLPMDLWSRKIVGYHAGDTLEAEGAVRALETALKELPKGAFPVHHSDRGCRYCSHRYVEKLHARGLAVSRLEELHCYENARAERLNGILKQEYGLGCAFRNKKQALAAVDEAVFLYNTKRPHLALTYETPEKMHHRAA
jgi:transposase InsO family protein